MNSEKFTLSFEERKKVKPLQLWRCERLQKQSSTLVSLHCLGPRKGKRRVVTSASASPSFVASRSGMIMSTFVFALIERSTHMTQVDPRFVVTCLIFWEEPQLFAINLEPETLQFSSSFEQTWRCSTDHICPGETS